MDHFDHAILQIVQDDCSLGYEAIAEKVGLSASAVRRRLVNLKRSGVIVAERAIVDPSHIGVTLIVSVSLGRMEDYEAWLDEHLLREPTIKRVETNVVYSRVKFETAVSTARLTES